MILRPDQRAAVEGLRAAYAQRASSVLLQAPTGFGKTTVAAEIIRLALERRRRVVFAAHLDALLEDTRDRLEACGIHAGIVQADRQRNPDACVQIASTATLHARGERPPADLVILDEAHRAMGPTVRAILEGYPKAKLLGLTATPQRGDGQPLGDVFGRMVEGPSVRELTRRGHLAPCDVIAPPTHEERGLAADPIDAWKLHAPGSRAICFASNVSHAEQIVSSFSAAGVEAELVVGDTPAEVRQSVRERMTSGSLRVLVGVAVFLEGFDLPAIETVVLARAFGVTGSYLQAVGRGLRPSPSTGKTRCMVLDLRGAVNLHGLPDEERRWSLTGDAVRRVEAMTALARCKECLAIFRPSATCPRCGARAESAPQIPRILHRAEVLERVSGLSQSERDARYLRTLERVARVRLRLPEHRVRAWAERQFAKRFGREVAA